MILLALDSTLLNTYGHQEGEDFNFHYQDHGYHPLVCYDGITGDLLKIQLRNRTDYSSTGVRDFLQSLPNEFGNDIQTFHCFSGETVDLPSRNYIISVKQMVYPMPFA